MELITNLLITLGVLLFVGLGVIVATLASTMRELSSEVNELKCRYHQMVTSLAKILDSTVSKKDLIEQLDEVVTERIKNTFN